MGKALKKALYILLIAAALTGFALGGVQLYRESYVNLGGVSYPRDTEILDLSGRRLSRPEKLARFYCLRQVDLRGCRITAEDYDLLRGILPEQCSILWELPFQDTYYPHNTRTIRIDTLSLEEAALLDYLPQLQSVEAWECRDYEALFALQQRRPDCKVFYNVELSGQLFDCDTENLVLRDTRDDGLPEKLMYLPKLRTAHFTGELPPAKELLALAERYPQVGFSWTVTVGDSLFGSDTELLDLTGHGIESVAELDSLLHYFPRLQTLRLGATSIPEEALLALEQGFPALFIQWEMDICGKTVSRDAREVDLSGIPIDDIPALEERLSRMPFLEKVIMCGCGPTSEEMDALDKRHPDIRFVWSVDLGGILLRTDATWYAPNKYYIKVDDSDLEGLRYCYDMVCIDIGHMRGVTHCQWAANMPQLRYLILADTNIKDISPLAGLENLVFLELFTAPIRDYTPLLECPGLEDLNLGYTYGNPAPVMEMTWLKRLWWPGSLRVLTWPVRNQLRTNLPDAKMNFVAGSSTGEGWRSGQHYYDMRDLMGMPYMTG